MKRREVIGKGSIMSLNPVNINKGVRINEWRVKARHCEEGRER